MIDLWSYFINNAFNKKLGAYEKYFNIVNSTGRTKLNRTNFEIYDDEDAIQNFKSLIQPRNDYTNQENIEFILICYYLYSCGYTIVEFPNFLARPTNLETFSNKDIKFKAKQVYGTNNAGAVTWESRRRIIDGLQFKKENSSIVKASLDLENIFKTISPRNATFESMESDEKLQTICNAIENMLKVNGKFITLDYSSYSLGYITDEIVKNFRKRTQCFRHADEQSIKEREAFTDIEKDFCINFGLTICTLIYRILSDTKES